MYFSSGEQTEEVWNKKRNSEDSEFLFDESDRRGSNPRSRPWQGRALPTTPLSHLCRLLFISDMLYLTGFRLICQQVFQKKLKKFSIGCKPL